jgi:hypothetical protein
VRRETLEEVQVGKRTIAGTEWPIVDQLHRTGEREWVITRELCNGIARSSEVYRSESAAREAFDRRLLGRRPREAGSATEVVKLRATRDEVRAWDRAAGEQSRSEWLRDLANRAAR